MISEIAEKLYPDYVSLIVLMMTFSTQIHFFQDVCECESKIVSMTNVESQSVTEINERLSVGISQILHMK